MTKNMIDKYKAEQDRLAQSIEDKKSEVAFKNSKIEAKIQKLQEEAFRNRQELETYINQINMDLSRNAKLIKAESEYAAVLSESYVSYIDSKKKTTNKSVKRS